MQMRMTIMEQRKKNKKVLLGLSGGVDSTAAALLLSEKGYDVTGYYFDINGKNTAGALEAAALAENLGIDLITEDVSEDFSACVIDNFCKEYASGRTPNPCVICNPLIKFRKLAERADEIGAFYIATGHYCRIFEDRETGFFYPRKAVNTKKDQSYMLYRLGQDILRRVIFPLGDFEDKEQIRQIARSGAMENAEKKDSLEICFIQQDTSHSDFIEKMGYPMRPGDFTDSKGNVIGRHKGIASYTVGQRKGLGVALGRPAYVTSIDAEQNRVILGSNEDLFKKEVVSEQNFFTGISPKHFEGRKLTAKIRYTAKGGSAFIKVNDKKIITTFEEPQRAPAPGQSIVFYDGDVVVGGGFII